LFSQLKSKYWRENIALTGIPMPERNIRSNPFISILIPAAVLLLLCLCLLTACGHADGSKGSKDSVSSPEASMENGASPNQDPLWSDLDSMTAMVLSDLHYTDKKEKSR
jgi:hypothetical protein